MPSHGSKESDIIFAAGVTAGYAHCLENLRKLAVFETAREPEATFDKQY
jgi:polyisoprenoid-binding protein YceI